MADHKDPMESIRARARSLGIGCLWRSDEHQVSYWRWKIVSLALSVSAAVFASAAGATLLTSANTGSGWAIVAGIFGLLGAVLTTANAQLGASTTAESHRKAAAAFAGFATSYFDLSSLPATDLAAMRSTLEDLNTRKSQSAQDAPLPEPWAITKVEKQRAKRRKQPVDRHEAAADTRPDIASPEAPA